MRRAVCILGLVAGLITTSSCVRWASSGRHPGRPTGTCPGVCAHYVDCKGTPDDNTTYNACVSECRETYDDPRFLAEYERLSCPDAVGFIEGSSGRGPGE